MKILKVSVYAWVIFFSLCLSSPAAPFSSDMKGTTGGLILKLEGSVRDISMGRSASAASYGADAVFSNPAGLSVPGGGKFSASHARLIEDIHFSQVAALLRQKNNALALYGAYLGMDEIDKVTAAGYPNASGYSPYFLSAGAYFSTKIGEDEYLGGGLKGIFQDIDSDNAWALACDLGYLRKDENVITAISLRNAGMNLKFRQKSDPLPFNVNAGLAWHTPLNGLLFSGNVSFPVDNIPSFHLGCEYDYRVGKFNLKPRAGYNTARAQDYDVMSGFSAGAGFGVGILLVDYAWVPWGEPGNTHRISLSLSRRIVEPPSEKNYIYGKKEKQKYIELFYMEGLRHFGDGDLQQAADYFERVLELAPNHSRAKEYLRRIRG